MALASLDELWPDLICPSCRSPIQHEPIWQCENETCDNHSRGFPECDSTPVFIDFNSSIVDRSLFTRPSRPSWSAAAPSLLKRLAAAAIRVLNGKNNVSRRNAEILRSLVRKSGRKRILIVGGASIGSGAEALYDDPVLEVVAFDIVPSPFTQFVGDAHAIPLRDASVDGVWVQAVLEHVLDPARVVSEIARVVSAGGFVYADTPFMQQVHLGPYDFTRFTESGHRWLFRDFERLDSGVVWGAGAQLAWSLDYAVRALTNSTKAGRLAHLGALPMAWFIDRVSSPRYASDAACAVYFLGRKGTKRLDPREMVDYYTGAQVHSLQGAQ